MNTENSDQEFKQLFSELRSRDSQHAPSFSAIANAANRETSAWRISFPRFRVALGTIIVLVFVTGITLIAFRLHTRSVEREMQQWETLSGWEAPTDALLSIASSPWSSTVATSSDFLINTNTTDTTMENL